jgi:hypothetical protein
LDKLTVWEALCGSHDSVETVTGTQKIVAHCIIASVRLVHRTEADKREDFIQCLRRSTDGYTLCQVGNPDSRTYLQQTQIKLIYTIQLIDKGIGFCHFINPWEGENTNCVKKKTQLGN